MDFKIVTSVVNTIQMNNIQEILLRGSYDLIPVKVFQALEIILNNLPNSLRLVNNIISN